MIGLLGRQKLLSSKGLEAITKKRHGQFAQRANCRLALVLTPPTFVGDHARSDCATLFLAITSRRLIN